MGKLIGLLMVAGLLSACASNPNRAEELDTKIEHSAPVSSGLVIGVKDGEMIAQRKVMMSEQLRDLQNQTFELESKVFGGERYLDGTGLYGVLKSCQTRSGQHIQAREYVIPDDTYKAGMESGSIIGLHREYLLKRIARFREYKRTLNRIQNEYENQIQSCELAGKVGSNE